jgi:hypothetical protein
MQQNEKKVISHGSDEWKAVRSGKFTPSELYRLMTEPRTKSDLLSAGAVTYVKEKVAELLTFDLENEKQFTGNAATEWGNSYEEEAIEVFSDLVDAEIIQPGFLNFSEHFGGTPDGVSKDGNFGIEVKCPFNSTIHLDNVLLNEMDFKKERKEYYWQIQGYSLITGIKDWYFVSYDPRNYQYKLKYLLIKRNEEDINLIKEKLSLATEYKNKLINNLKQVK